MTDRPILAALPHGENWDFLEGKPGVWLAGARRPPRDARRGARARGGEARRSARSTFAREQAARRDLLRRRARRSSTRRSAPGSRRRSGAERRSAGAAPERAGDRTARRPARLCSTLIVRAREGASARARAARVCRSSSSSRLDRTRPALAGSRRDDERRAGADQLAPAAAAVESRRPAGPRRARRRASPLREVGPAGSAYSSTSQRASASESACAESTPEKRQPARDAARTRRRRASRAPAAESRPGRAEQQQAGVAARASRSRRSGVEHERDASSLVGVAEQPESSAGRDRRRVAAVRGRGQVREHGRDAHRPAGQPAARRRATARASRR